MPMNFSKTCLSQHRWSHAQIGLCPLACLIPTLSSDFHSSSLPIGRLISRGTDKNLDRPASDRGRRPWLLSATDQTRRRKPLLPSWRSGQFPLSSSSLVRPSRFAISFCSFLIWVICVVGSPSDWLFFPWMFCLCWSLRYSAMQTEALPLVDKFQLVEDPDSA